LRGKGTLKEASQNLTLFVWVILSEQKKENKRAITTIRDSDKSLYRGAIK
jgi:hypothetical protein